MAGEIEQHQPSQREGIGGEGETSEKPAVEARGQPQHDQALEGPGQGDPFPGEGQRRYHDNEKGREGKERHQQSAVPAAGGQETVDHDDIEGGEGQG